MCNCNTLPQIDLLRLLLSLSSVCLLKQRAGWLNELEIDHATFVSQVQSKGAHTMEVVT